jgi:hypothetical protein
MAVVELQKSSTRASGGRMGLTFFTTTRVQPCDNPGREHPSVRRNGRRITGAAVEAEERGNEDVANEADPIEPAERQRAQRAPQYDSEAARRRSELARDLLGRTEQMMPLVNDPALAVNIRLLRKDLAGCHDRLKDSPSESDFLSLVTLIESAIATRKWKEYTQDLLEQIHSAIDIGYRKSHVRFEDYDQVRRQFLAGSAGASPRIDLQSLNMSDVQDDEEGQATDLS